ncbi:S16 family serine protease [Streptomyces sp. TRM 70351]|uniref:S16 family serine protease n=1 Tax=Streptomyces sp. TRM 70351 TaxID=3116552 RepID=UPI002E7C2B61|nr:S16 family serine protease [Streptomyces sp. TRM 70351]MEE1928112.1 S16 family serine protease [Streptomyces sp. TRM 70351]
MSALASRRRPVLAVCAALLLALFALTALAPLPYTLAHPGVTADVGGEHEGRPVITVTGPGAGEPREPDGALLMTTIAATSPDATVRLADVLGGWFATDRAVMPRDVVYPVGDSTEEIRDYNSGQMARSQEAAVRAALAELGLSGGDVTVRLRLDEIGGPSAGLLFALGIVDAVEGDGNGGGLTGGRTVAGTGTIDEDGTVGPVGGVPLKTQAAARDGAEVFLVPEAECAEARSERPEGLRLVPVRTLDGALDALAALREGEEPPRC